MVKLGILGDTADSDVGLQDLVASAAGLTVVRGECAVPGFAGVRA